MKKKSALQLWKLSFKKYWQLYLLLLPVIANYVIFHYIPMAGIQIAFKDFSLRQGIWDSPWVGFEHFVKFFHTYNFWTILWNTLALSLLGLVFSFPLSVILALLLNEIRQQKLNNALQTVFFIPHFISVVVVVGMMTAFLSPSTGIVNTLLIKLGIIDEGIYFTRLAGYFRPMYIISGLWQNTGWGTVIYMSALTAIDQELYEAARVDGASRLQQVTHITIPCLVPTIVVQLILKCGHIMSVGYEKVLLMQTSTNLPVSQIISTYVYNRGIENLQYDFATAVGLFNSVINLILLCLVNWIAKKKSEVSLW